jgi:hypothetical protein
MSVFNVLPSGVNTFFPTFWRVEGEGCGSTLSRSHSCCAGRLVYEKPDPAIFEPPCMWGLAVVQGRCSDLLQILELVAIVVRLKFKSRADLISYETPFTYNLIKSRFIIMARLFVSRFPRSLPLLLPSIGT